MNLEVSNLEVENFEVSNLEVSNLEVRNFINEGLEINYLWYTKETISSLENIVFKIVNLIKSQKEGVLEEIFTGKSARNFSILYNRFNFCQIGKIYFSLFTDCPDDFIQKFCSFEMGIFMLIHNYLFFSFMENRFERIFFYYQIIEKNFQMNINLPVCSIPIFVEEDNRVHYKVNKFYYINCMFENCSKKGKIGNIFMSFFENFSNIDNDAKNAILFGIISSENECDFDHRFTFFKKLSLNPKCKYFLQYIFEKLSKGEIYEYFYNNSSLPDWISRKNVTKICNLISS